MIDPLENTWLDQLRQGDERALRRIFDKYYALLLSDIYRLIPDEDTCQDLAQEVFVELWKKRAGLEVHTSLRAYLKKAAVNRALNHIKAQKKYAWEEAESASLLADDTWHTQSLQAEKADLEAALHRAIDTLPDRCRVVFSLSRFENLSHREIADQLGISVKTIENQITKAMKLLREALLVMAVLSPVGIIWLKWYI